MKYTDWHETKIQQCIELIDQAGISDNFDYAVNMGEFDAEEYKEGDKDAIRNIPWIVRTRAYPYRNQNISFVGTNPGKNISPDEAVKKLKLLSPGADGKISDFINTCASEWKSWLSNGSKAQVYHHVLQILDSESHLDVNTEIDGSDDVRSLISGEFSSDIYDVAHFTNWFPLASKDKSYLDKFPDYKQFATRTLKKELEIVNPSLVCLCSTPAVRHNTINEWSLLPDQGTYSNPPAETLNERSNISDVLGGIYSSDSFPAPVAMFPHPSQLYHTHKSWSIDGDGMRTRFREGLRAVDF